MGLPPEQHLSCPDGGCDLRASSFLRIASLFVDFSDKVRVILCVMHFLRLVLVLLLGDVVLDTHPLWTAIKMPCLSVYCNGGCSARKLRLP